MLSIKEINNKVTVFKGVSQFVEEITVIYMEPLKNETKKFLVRTYNE